MIGWKGWLPCVEVLAHGVWRVRSGKGRYYPLQEAARLPQSSTRLQIPEALPKPYCQNIFHLLDYLVLLPATTEKIWR